jgi:ketosteroid isomerase-like protein
MPDTISQTALCVLLTSLGGCTSATPPDHAQLVAQVTAAEVAFAKTMADRDFAVFRTYIAEDAVFIGKTSQLRGRAAVEEGWKELYAESVAPFAWKPELVEVNDAGTLAISTGPISRPDGRVLAHYYSTWRRDTDGRWRVVFDNGYDVCDCAKQ